MSFGKHEIVCDVFKCENVTSSFSVVDNGWKWIDGRLDVCPDCQKRLIEKYGDNWVEHTAFKKKN